MFLMLMKVSESEIPTAALGLKSSLSDIVRDTKTVSSSRLWRGKNVGKNQEKTKNIPWGETKRKKNIKQNMKMCEKNM